MVTLILSIRFASNLKSIPFEMQDDSNLYVQKFRSRPKKLLSYVVTAVSLLYTAIQCVAFGINILQHGFTTQNSLHSLIVLRLFLSSLFFINNLFKVDGIVWEINQLSSMMQGRVLAVKCECSALKLLEYFRRFISRLRKVVRSSFLHIGNKLRLHQLSPRIHPACVGHHWN